ncbi:inhibitor of host transcription [Erwinia phage FBB1]|nr:inhibitor of host transcription [Erwinia phage FBB1]
MNMQSITNEMIVTKYGDRHDGIQVYKGNRRVGYLTDLRRDMFSAKKSRTKQKEYNNRVTEQRREAMPEAVNEMKEFLENQLSKLGAEVFINITQPNVHLNGHKCYITVDPTYGKHRLGILHKSMTASEMSEEVDSCYKISPCVSEHQILINSIEKDAIVETITKLCSI